MSDDVLSMLSLLFRIYTVGLCVGVSTIAMTFYFFVVAKGRTEPAQNILMHVVYTVLRIGMVLVMVSELTTFLYNFHIGNSVYWTDNPELLMRLSVFTVICCNAFAMQHRKVSMWLGPVFAGGSWYTYFFLSVWVETGFSYGTLLMSYIGWLVIFGLLLAALRIYLTRDQNNRIGDGAYRPAS